MEFTRELDVTPEEFFDQIERSIIDDVQRATGKRVSRNKLAGLKYQKRSSQVRKSNVTMNVKIRKYRYPEVYEVHFAYDSGSNTIRYQVEPRGEDGLTLTYREKFVNPAPERGLFANFRLRRYEKRAERRADQTLKAIVRQAKKDRQNHHGQNPLLEQLESEED
ncbi:MULTISPECIES: DUF3284 domain-containing protein [Collinsella]|uniref:DUF3284 domain-containing protein n=1 Tax=Collinsella TaxID=102106 RepID=UPI000B37221F|nr:MULTISPECIES: DUF3284 domain-containing protein [Collinsella]MBM6683798.1 DUF3284 domain-containing protein [Collinsella intestinalis]OUN46133.1 hypothetical protein B5G20_09220 [Collinsella sp. An7]